MEVTQLKIKFTCTIATYLPESISHVSSRLHSSLSNSIETHINNPTATAIVGGSTLEIEKIEKDQNESK